MSRMSFFSSPFLLGFDEFEQRLDRLAKAADGYPPYNIERVAAEDGSETFQISIAVAGFAEDELEITLEDNQLLIRGRQADDPAREFLHRGIAARQFQRSFLLAEAMLVEGADLRDGLLNVMIRRPNIEKVTKRIKIKSAN
ncbi:Hsp20 family protein [Maritalea sp.]|uniref:Hsp20 family protein n=1 Tax=Maritalea sp. TaxID=2003361 RepID=UPI0039E2B56D